mmetsp:Transcript_34674/g.40136  ORF Transcript_34674/g.40136 Transcript_34674/m.40136 type:complete len:88 (-) Transcript_34674:104-367(-)
MLEYEQRKRRHDPICLLATHPVVTIQAQIIHYICNANPTPSLKRQYFRLAPFSYSHLKIGVMANVQDASRKFDIRHVLQNERLTACF